MRTSLCFALPSVPLCAALLGIALGTQPAGANTPPPDAASDAYETLTYCAKNGGSWSNAPDQAVDHTVCRFRDGAELRCDAGYEACIFVPAGAGGWAVTRTSVNAGAVPASHAAPAAQSALRP
ncbi:MAG: hypothetical protein R3F55_05585 [Alphaproteobacteria bacterium]